MIDLLNLLLRLSQLRQGIERRMSALPERFNREATKGRLRLRPWRRRKGAAPYAIYWIILNRRRIAQFSWQRSKPVFPFRRPKIRTRQDLDDAIFFARASKVRRIVYRYHAQLRALNGAHSSISKAVDTLRKRLNPFRSLAAIDEPSPQLWPRRDVERVARLFRGFEAAVDEARLALHGLELDLMIHPGLPYRLVYEQDLEHPYGRLRWHRKCDGRPLPPLTDRLKRSLRLSPELSRLITPYEQRRRRAVRRMNALNQLWRRLRSMLARAQAFAQELLKTRGIDIPLRKESA